MRSLQSDNLTLLDLFPDEDYRFHMGLRKGDAAKFYAHSEQHDFILNERARWIDESPERYAAWNDDARPIFDEFAAFLRASNILPESPSNCAELGRQIEPDFVLLRPDSERIFRLIAGVVCFPSGWALQEKVGLPASQIHAPVPRLNPTLERQINAFLARLAPEVSWERENWGLARTSELNAHPARQLPRLIPPLTPAEIWLRIEHQSFLSLPQTGGLVFGIRVNLHPMPEVIHDTTIARNLARALKTMPEEIARYKGLSDIRADLVAASSISAC